MRLALLLCALVAVFNPVEPLSGHAAAGPSQESHVSAEQNPFVGSWEANLAKSKRDANHQFERATLQFAVAGDSVTITHGGVDASGHQESGVTTLKADGKEHPFPGAPGVTHITRWLGSHVLETVGRKGDRTTGRGTYEVSADGKTLTATVSGIDASGKRFAQVIVFDRK
jgi:hypothetical protein